MDSDAIEIRRGDFMMLLLDGKESFASAFHMVRR